MLAQNDVDHVLKGAVQDELDWASNVRGDRIGVAVTDGAVTLSGEVLSFPEKTAAVGAALRVRGVAALADEIVVRHAFGKIEDVDIARDAAIALDRTVLVSPDAMKATVRDHSITLTGTVGWQHQRAAAAAAVGAVAGVVAVRNEIELKPPVAMLGSADAEANVSAALLRNAQVDAEGVAVTVSGSEIRLTGYAPTWAARHEAENAAWCTPGVTHVDDQIVIRA